MNGYEWRPYNSQVMNGDHITLRHTKDKNVRGRGLFAKTVVRMKPE